MISFKSPIQKKFSMKNKNSNSNLVNDLKLFVILKAKVFRWYVLRFGCPTPTLYHLGYPHDKIRFYTLTKEAIFDNASRLYASGRSLSSIASELGITKSAVRHALVSGGVVLRPHSKRQAKGKYGPKKCSLRTAPYGHCLVNGKLEIDPKEMSVVRLIMKWWHQGFSHCAIARKLNEQKVRPRKASKWSQPTVGFIIKRQLELETKEEKKTWESQN